MRTFEEAVSDYFDIDISSWLEKGNFYLNINEDYAAFEKHGDSFQGHYFFVSKGGDAVKSALLLRDRFFKETESKALVGITPLTNLGARWMSRRIGLKSNGVVEIETGPAELFILTRQEWETNNE